MKNNNVLGNKIKEVRKELRLTQEQLSKRMSISRSTLRDIETGRYKHINLELIDKLSKATNKPTSYFLEDEIEIDLGIYDVMDNIFNEMIERDLVDNDGNFSPELNEKILEIVKATLALKKERLNK